MKILRIFSALMLLASSGLAADFSDSQVKLHPRYPGAGPFILEVVGAWPSDCHPGEQKPVISSFDGRNLEIEFEIVVVHITCNMTDTAYRVLVDMSEELDKTKSNGESLDVRISFGGETLEQRLDLVCPENLDCPAFPSERYLPEKGLYVNPGLPSQGLLVAWQGPIAAIYPLVYDEGGDSEWLFSVGRIAEDSYFSDLYRWEGGDCFGCVPSGELPQMTEFGHLSVLVDHPGTLQVQVNQEPFTEYRKLVYGYNIFPLGPAGTPPLTGLAGRWAISENRGTNPPLGSLADFLPGVFDLVFIGPLPSDADLALTGQVSYLLQALNGDVLGEVVCKGDTSPVDGVNVCDFIDPTDAAEPLFLFYQTGPSSLEIQYGRAVIAIGTPPGGTAVRLD